MIATTTNSSTNVNARRFRNEHTPRKKKAHPKLVASISRTPDAAGVPVGIRRAHDAPSIPLR
jgi:hypothetical protein